MTSNATHLADPATLISLGSLVVAIASAAASWFSFTNAARALRISEQQEKKRDPQLRVYFANGYRRLVPNRQIFGMLISVSNPSDINNSISRAELQVVCRIRDGMMVTYRIQHNSAIGQCSDTRSEDAANIFTLPAQIGAHQTISGWFLFSLENAIIADGTVDSHRIVIFDTHNIETITDQIMVRAWTDETEKN
jgi:hypothetical protein